VSAASALVPGVRFGLIGLPWRPRVLLVTVVLLAAAAAAGVIAAGVGQAVIPPDRVLAVLTGGGSSADRFVLVQLRLPRVLGGLLVGCALGIAGALAQTFARNPLATPDVLGVQSGAAAGAVAVIVLGGGTYSVSTLLTQLGVPVAAFLGAVIAAALVYGLSWREGIQGYRLVLVGIGIGAALTALTSYLLVLALVSDAAEASAWLVGSLSSVEWESLPALGIALAIAVPAALAASSTLRLDVLGDDAARSLGARLGPHRIVVLGASVLLAAAATSVGGPIAFVALVCPQVATRLARTDRPPLLASAGAGALLVSAADTLGRTVTTWEIPVGLTTVVLGAPYLLWLILRRRGAIG
jgi:iron complex transport system permease protein